MESLLLSCRVLPIPYKHAGLSRRTAVPVFYMPVYPGARLTHFPPQVDPFHRTPFTDPFTASSRA
jgi:hypothetical protein